MPIDDALESLEGVPKHLLKTYLIPTTIEELQEMYEDKFEIYTGDGNSWWKSIKLLNQNNRDINGNVRKTLLYSFNLTSEPLKRRVRCLELFDNRDDDVQLIYKDNDLFRSPSIMYKTENNNKTKKDIEEWFDKTEKLILKSIPELEEFVEKYAYR
jgi:hypothetical protein